MVEAIADTKRWVEEAVLGLGLCPFAVSAWADDGIRFATTSHQSLDDIIDTALAEVEILLARSDVQTTLLVIENGQRSFEDFITTANILEAAMEESGADQFFIVATFHPDYRFESEEPQYALTNRAPFPTFHFIRQADFDAIGQEIADEIVANNRVTIDGLTDREVTRIWSHLFKK